LPKPAYLANLLILASSKEWANILEKIVNIKVVSAILESGEVVFDGNAVFSIESWQNIKVAIVKVSKMVQRG